MPSESSTSETRRNPRIGRYEIVQYIATGGMGAVYKAWDTENEREVALKVLPPEVAVKPGMLERFKQEAIHAAKLHHEHIVTLYEYGEASHTHYLAMEYIEGIDVHEYVSRKGPLGPDEARVIIAQAGLALEHAHEQGIIHRDIKPSNFLITRKKGRLWVKLTDFGLAREVKDDEFRVTRAGSTVGTVDYMSPEQARDSRATDRRSDIYSLGCTLYFMLAGRPPFHEGGLTERIMQHVEAEPQDICKLNPLVPHTLAAVLQRMLAKKPAHRYQTATALLEDLERLRGGTGPGFMEVFNILEEVEDSSIIKRRIVTTSHVGEQGNDSPDLQADDSTLPRRKPDSSTQRRRRNETDTDDERPAAQTQAIPAVRPPVWKRHAVLIAVMACLALAVGGGLTWWWLTSGKGAAPAATTRPVDAGQQQPRVEPPTPVPPEPPILKPEPPKPETNPPPIVKPDPPRPDAPRRLFPAAPPVEVKALQAEIEKPFVTRRVVPRAPMTFRVSRSVSPKSKGEFTSLAAAIEAAPVGVETTIYIEDSGPLHEHAIEARNKSLVLRTGRVHRPLLAWDRKGSTATAFLTVTGGNLTLENLDLVADAGTTAENLVLCRVTGGGDFLAENCTFSVAGQSRGGVTMIQLEGRLPNPTEANRARCRLTRCYLRGGDAVALELRTPGVDVLVEDCLLTGGKRPLLNVAGKNADAPTTLRVVRSTLVAAQNILRVQPAAADDTRPQVHWIGWDVLLTRCSDEAGGEMVVLAEGATAEGLHWHATNSLYAGWQWLLSGRETVAASNMVTWHTRWGRVDGDQAIRETWPVRVFSTLSDEPAEAFQTAKSSVYYAGTAGGELLGCNLGDLPPSRDTWHAWTFGRVAPPVFFMPNELSPPEFPAPIAGVYHGEKLNLNEVDLGEHLESVRKRMPFGSKVVLHLSGAGERPTSPIRVTGTHLVLYAEPGDEKQPLVLTYEGNSNPDALIAVEDGTLELLGVSIKLANITLYPHPKHLIRVRGGDLRIFGCRLTGPLSKAPRSFAGLIGFEGSGDSSAAKSHDCGIADSMLASGNTCIHTIGVGARVRLRNCVVVAGQDAIHLDPGNKAKPRLNNQCFLDSCTVAARRAVARLTDVSDLIPLEPFVVQTHSCLFLDPFTGPDSEAGLLVHEGDALVRGLFVWQGDLNGYDRRMPGYFSAIPRTGPRPPQSHPLWARLWGSAGDRAALVLDLKGRTFDLDKLPLESLALPSALRPKRAEPLGADLQRLRLLKKADKSKG